MKKFIRIAALLLACTATLSLAACSKTTKNVPENGYKYGKVKIQALGGGACGAPSYIAYEKGFFKQQGLDVTLVSGTLDELKAGLASGEFTVANGDFQFFPSIQQGLDLKIIGGLHQGCIKVVVPPNSPIKSVADLKGKRIGIDEPGGTPQAITSVALANAGIDPTKGVTWVTYPLDQLTTAVTKGEVDAFAAWDPYGAQAIKDDNYSNLVDIATDPLFKGKSCCFLYASGTAIKNDPGKVEALARAYQEADTWIAANPKETAEIEINKKYVAASDVNFLTSLLTSYKYNYTTTAAQNDIKYFVTQLNKTGFLNKNTDPDTFEKQVYWDALSAK
jgi:NitT/TauT family transport system substrate-binding protein